jgi:hypothetical protein
MMLLRFRWILAGFVSCLWAATAGAAGEESAGKLVVCPAKVY